MNRTTVAKPHTIERKWYVVDAAHQPLGRVAAQVAQVLRGKHKPIFDYHVDCGDFVVIINADKVTLTGNNKKDELLYWHSGWPGGIKNISREDLREKNSARLIEKAVWGMLPKGPLGRSTFSKLKVYAGADHPHAAQNPVPLDIKKGK